MDKIVKIFLIILILILFFKNYKENFSANGCKDEDDNYCGDEGYCAKNGICYPKVYCTEKNRNKYWPSYDYIRHHKCRDVVCDELNDNCEYDEMLGCLTKHLGGVGCTSIPTQARELNIAEKCKINPENKDKAWNHVNKICNLNKPIPNDQFKKLVYDYFVGDRLIVIDKTNPIPMIEYKKWIFDENKDNRIGNIEIGYQHPEYQEYYDKAISNIKQKMPDYTNKLTKKIIKEYGRIEEWNVSLVTDMSNSFSDLPANCLGQLWWSNYFIAPHDILRKKVMTHPSFNIDIHHAENAGLTIQGNYDSNFPTLINALNNSIDEYNDLLYNNNDNKFIHIQPYVAIESLDLSKWDVSKVTNMKGMFGLGREPNIQDFWYTFEKNVPIYNKDVIEQEIKWYNFNPTGLNNWNVGNVEDMSYMFHNCLLFNQDIGRWNVSKVKNMKFMFALTRFFQDSDSVKIQYYIKWLMKEEELGNIIDLTVNEVKSLDENKRLELLKRQLYILWFDPDDLIASRFNKDISKWDVGKVENMRGMFVNSHFHQDIGNWNVSNVKNMSYMFFASGIYTLGVESPGTNIKLDWDVSNVKYMNYMFAHSAYNVNINDWNVSNVKNMSYMFYSSVVNNGEDMRQSNRPLLWNGTITGNIRGMFWESFFNQSLDQLNIIEDIEDIDEKNDKWDCRTYSFKEYEMGLTC
jgi:surface protein